VYALIVEPQPRRAALFVGAAEAEGLDPALVASDEAARGVVAARGRPALCILELTVANVDGFRLLAGLRTLEPPIPAIVVSAFSELRESAWKRRNGYHIAVVLGTDLDMAVARHAVQTALGRAGRPRAPTPQDPRDAQARALRLRAASLSRAPDTERALQELVDEVARSFGVDAALCALHDGTHEIRLAHAGLDPRAILAPGSPRETGIARQIVEALDGEALVVTDALDHPAFTDNPLVREGLLRGFAGVPLETGDGLVMGALSLVHGAPLDLAVADVNRLHAIARRMSGELELVRRPRRAGDERAAYALAHFSRLVEHLDQPLALWAPDGRLRLANPALSRLFGQPAETLVQLGVDAFADLLAGLTDDAEFVDQFRRRPPAPAVLHEEVSFPGEPPRTWRWSSKPIELPDGVGALDTWLDVTAERELARAALTDALTGLANRRGGEAAIRRELARAARSGVPLAFLLVDIDHFKRVNDVHGHATGDRVIRAVALVLAAALRTTDVPARWGGEEFLALLPDADAAAACRIAERVRAAVEATEAAPGLFVTVSIGVAQWDGRERPETAIGRADAGLYAAKDAGRNCVR
jgi:diguanylate cyclase (GGDEF)-like protein